MTDYEKLEERRQMARRNYYAQMAMMGYDSGGNALDLVEVVRCRDCKYGESEDNGEGEDMVMCNNKHNPVGFDNWLTPPEWFCADGEWRKPDA